MKKFIISIILLSYFSCNYQVVGSINRKEECTEFIKYIDKIWLKHKSKKLYKCKDKKNLIPNINNTYKNCFYSLDYEEIKIIFGEPNKEFKNEILYYKISEDCEKEFTPCKMFVINFNNFTGKPLYVNFGKTEFEQ